MRCWRRRHATAGSTSERPCSSRSCAFDEREPTASSRTSRNAPRSGSKTKAVTDMNESTAPDRYAVIGHPVSHSWSPFIHGMFAKQTNQNISYARIEAASEDFERQVGAFF